jgi:hypothetical protein
MKRYCALKSLVLIFVLLTSQLGNAFAFASQMPDCGMNTAASAEHVTPTMMTDMAQTMSNEHNPPDSRASGGQMDCCDSEATNACCNSDDCQCNSLVSASMFVGDTMLNKAQKNNLTPVIFNLLNPLSPFLHQPKRPPIKNIS